VLLEVMIGLNKAQTTHLQNHDPTALTNPIDQFRTKGKSMVKRISRTLK
jgi:hypothetical protein